MAGGRVAVLMGAEARSDDDRPAPVDDPVLPEQTSDDTDEGWGERLSDDDRRLLEDRPPHWEE